MNDILVLEEVLKNKLNMLKKKKKTILCIARFLKRAAAFLLRERHRAFDGGVYYML